jgi:hypothetical protein
MLSRPSGPNRCEVRDREKELRNVDGLRWGYTREEVSGNSIFFRAFAKLLKATMSVVMSVCPSARNNSAPTGRIFMKFDL